MRALTWLLSCVLVCAALSARELEDFRGLRAMEDESAQEPSEHNRIAEKPRSISDRNFSFALQVELRPLSNPNGFFFGFGAEIQYRFHDRLWLNTAVAIFGGSARGISHSPRSFGKERSFSAAGLELRSLLRWDFAWWPKGGMYALTGISTGYFYGSGGGNRALHTWSAGPTFLIGFEAGKRVRTGFESGATVYFALNRRNAGW